MPLIPDGYLPRLAAAAHLGIAAQTFDNQRRKSPDFPAAEYVGRTPLWAIAELDEWRVKHPRRQKRRTKTAPAE